MRKREYLTKDQRRIFQRLVNGENIFLTGNAGTGKSFLVDAFNEYCEENNIKILKVAPTGVAACNIKGVTLHKQFALKADVRSMLKEENELPEKIVKVINLASIILIDEISMVRIDVFDKIMRYIEIENKKRREKRRKELQIVFVGDFFQLSPVIPPEDRKMLNLHYGKEIGNGFAFQSKYWKSLNIQFEKLTEVKRQDGDRLFCTALDQCKEGDTDCLKFFATKTAKTESKKAIWVCGKNDTSAQKNYEKLSKIKGKEFCISAEYEGDVSEKDKLCEEKFIFKIGARVLMVVNEPNGLFQNGSMGEIKQVTNEGIIVEIDQKDNNDPLEVLVEKHEFCKYEYIPVEYKEKVIDERGEETTITRVELELAEVGKAIQYPMKLGFAITIHKSQGQTYEEMNLVPEIFQDGQLYVALSRCRAANKLHITKSLVPRMVRASQEVVNFYKNPENYTFFGEEQDIVSVQISKECECAVNLLNKHFKDNKERILDFLTALEKRKGKIKTEQLSLFESFDDIFEEKPQKQTKVS